jgi:hypothetical protein
MVVSDLVALLPSIAFLFSTPSLRGVVFPEEMYTWLWQLFMRLTCQSTAFTSYKTPVLTQTLNRQGAQVGTVSMIPRPVISSAYPSSSPNVQHTARETQTNGPAVILL